MPLRILLTILILSIPTIAFGAGLIPCGGPGQKECIACDFIKLGSNIINFLITIGAGIAVVLIAVAGLRMVMARGSSGEIEKAKAIFTNLVVGFIILLGAWLIVDTVLKTFAGSSGQFGTWNEIQCVYPKDYTQIDLYPDTIVAPPDGTPPPPPPGGTPPPPPPGGTPPPPPSADNSFTYQSGISSQKSHASGALNSLLSCMSGKVAASVGEISSISDSYIVNGSKTWAECAAGQCQHSANSCHYGGRNCVGKSYAVDFGDEGNYTALKNAAEQCGASAVFFEGNHVHVSVAGSCGCN